ncbi:MAG: hypothetical protein K5839_08320 [Treponemataceae bacterium]|nr:hypothetical protein [Treponemataceae bacterium]
MEYKQLIDRSPIRSFENATDGGLKAGEIGAIISKKGLGKTSVLVQIGMDSLLQDKKIVHVSFDQKSDSAMTWYEDIFSELTKKKNIGKPEEVKEEILKNRIILNFNQESVNGEQMVNTLKAMSEGGIKVETLVIDGWDYSKITPDAVKALKAYAKKAKLTVWFGVSTDETKKIFDSEIESNIDAELYLEQKPDSIEMKILRFRDEKNSATNLKLDSKTLLLAEK